MNTQNPSSCSTEGEVLRAYLNAGKRQQQQTSMGTTLLTPTSPLIDDDDMRDLEALESLTGLDDLITTVLSKDADLKELLGQQDAELDVYMDSFVNAHCEEAENLCDLYHQVTECEGKLNDFESQIREFLDRLTETADEVVQMQRSTDALHVRVQNRKAVKSEITLVYEAIMECGKFCDDIVRRDVDAAFLHEMRAYDTKLSKWTSLLESNPDLVGSAVDAEISPRLEVAAQRVGDKLQRYMQTRFDALQDPGINIVLHQQIMEATGQYAYRFLASYNRPVADKLKASYLYTISEVHAKAIRNALKDLIEGGNFASLPYEAILPDSVAKLIQDGYDVQIQKDFFLSMVKAFGGQQNLVKGDTVTSEAAACGLPPLSSPKSCRFYLREDEYLAEFVASNELSNLPTPSTSIPKRSTVMPLASPVTQGAKRAQSVGGGGSGGGGGPSSSLPGGFSGLNINSVKSMLTKLGNTATSSAKEAVVSPFAGAKDLRAATFENQVHALRAVHILEAPTTAASVATATTTGAAAGTTAAQADKKVSATSPPPLGVSPERKGGLSATPPATAPSGPLTSSPTPANGGSGAPAVTTLVPPNYMGTIVLDPIVVGRLAKTDCWVIRFIVLLSTVVNSITAERKFVRNFFLGHVNDSLKGDLEEEAILRTIFFQVLEQVESSLKIEIDALTDPISMLIGLRAVELLKNFVFQCPSPNPIMLLSTVFGTVSGALRDNLYAFLAREEKSLQRGLGIAIGPLDTNKFSIIQTAPTFNGEVDVVSMVQQDAGFASTLTVHPTVVAAAQLTAKLHALNVLHLKGSYVDQGSDATTFDDTVEGTLRTLIGHSFNFISLVANKRFSNVPSKIPSLVFIIVNLGHILYRWLAAARSARGLPSSMPLLVSHRRNVNADVSASTSTSEADSEATALMLRAQLLFDDEDQQIELKNTVSKTNGKNNSDLTRSVSPARPMRPLENSAASMSPSRARFTATQSLSQLDQTLSDTINAFIKADAATRYPALQAAATLLDAVDDGAKPEADIFAKVVADFGNGWQEQLLRIRTNIRVLVGTSVMMMIAGAPTPNGVLDTETLLKAAEKAVSSMGAQPLAAALPHVNAAVLTRAAEANEIVRRVLHDYYKLVSDTNARLVLAAKTFFPDDNSIQSKIIGPQALLHELQQLSALGGR